MWIPKSMIKHWLVICQNPYIFIKLDQKYNKLKADQIGVIAEHKSNIFTLSNLNLDNAMCRILECGLNFTLVPTRMLVKELICDIENAVVNLIDEKAEELRQECAFVIHNAKLPKCNIDRDEALALKNLKNNRDVMVLKVDKRNPTS